MTTNTHERLLLKLNTIRHYLPYGVQSMADECVAIVQSMAERESACGGEKGGEL